MTLAELLDPGLQLLGDVWHYVIYLDGSLLWKVWIDLYKQILEDAKHLSYHL